MSVDSRDFRKALGCFATGVTVVTALNEHGAPVGVTVNAFTSVSLDPPLVAFCLGRNSALFDVFVQAKSFVVNVLAADQQGLSNHFASRQYQADWSEIRSVATACGVPGLAGAAALIECGRENVLDGGDHAILLGRVTAVHAGEDEKPLLYFRGRYAELAAV
jgi:flavin reductase (DIM6/NTAB) family NADH-FMN oxidoreductase RutF